MSFFRNLFAPRVPSNPYEEEQQNKISQINTILAQMGQRSGEAMSRADMTTEQLFGEDIDRTRRSIYAGGEGARRGVTRGSMVRGGDPSGSLAASLLSIDQASNRAIGSAMTGFTRMATGERARERGRADALLQNVLGAEAGMLSRWDQRSDFERNLIIQNRQANRQFGLDLIGTVADTAGLIFPGGGGGGG